MPDYILRLSPKAAREIRTAKAWYARQNPAAARAFADELDHALNSLVQSPDRWPKFSQSVRRYVLPRFPFSVLYRVGSNDILIVAIAHQRRRPGYWER